MQPGGQPLVLPVDPARLIRLGWDRAALGDPRGAWQAFEAAMRSGHRDHAPAAAVALGNFLQQSGYDPAGAEAAFRYAIDTRHPDHAAAGWFHLGVLLADQGDLDRARAAYERALRHPNYSARAAYCLDALAAVHR